MKISAAYFRESGLKLNYDKTNFMIFSNRHIESLPNEIMIDNKSIKRERVIKFLGVMFDDKLKFSDHIENLMNKLTQACRVLSIIKYHLPRDLLIQFFHAHIMSHINDCAFLLTKISQSEMTRLQRIQNRCIKLIFGLDPRHPTIDLYRTYMKNTLPILAVAYLSLLSYIQKSRTLKKDELLKFDVNDSNRRSSGELVPHKFKRMDRIRVDISYLGVQLYNQLPQELKEIKNLKGYKKGVKLYLLSKLDLIFSDDQFQTRKIA